MCRVNVKKSVSITLSEVYPNSGVSITQFFTALFRVFHIPKDDSNPASDLSASCQ